MGRLSQRIRAAGWKANSNHYNAMVGLKDMFINDLKYGYVPVWKGNLLRAYATESKVYGPFAHIQLVANKPYLTNDLYARGGQSPAAAKQWLSYNAKFVEGGLSKAQSNNPPTGKPYWHDALWRANEIKYTDYIRTNSVENTLKGLSFDISINIKT